MIDKSVKTDPVHRAAWYISILLNPTTLGFLAVLLFSLLFGTTPSDKLILFGISFLFCVLLPFLYLVFLKRSNTIESLDVPVRHQRTVPYLLASISYIIGFVLLVWYGAPWPLIALMTAYLGNTLFIVSVNFFWKISAHAMGVGAVVTGFGIAISPVWYIGLILLPIVSWSRIKLDMHSRGQVIAGSILSIILTTIWFEAVRNYYPN
jgi:membrane-associated phospholipid phosphatase